MNSLLDPVLQNPWLKSAALLVGALLLAGLLRLFIVPLLRRLTGVTDTDLDDRIIARLSPTLFQSVMLIGLALALRGLVGEQGFWNQVVAAFMTLVVLIWGRCLLAVGLMVLHELGRRADRSPWIQAPSLPLFQFLYKVVFIGLMTYLIMDAWSIDLTTWLASAGVAGIAIGFAAKDTLANFISGIFILADAPYKVGDYVNIDGATRGEVTDIGMRSTRILTRDNIEVTVPNSVMGNAKIVNESSGPSPLTRVRVDVGVAYGSVVEQVRELLTTCAADVEHVVARPAPSVRFVAMGESALQFQVRVFVERPEYRGRVIDALNTRIYNALNAAGIEIPFPQRVVHMASQEPRS